MNVHRQRVYGLVIESPFPLPGVPLEADAGIAREVDLAITCTRADTGDLRCAHVTHPAPSSAAPEVGTTAAGEFCLAWAGELMFRFAADLRHLHVQSRMERPQYIPTIVIGLVLGLLLQRRGVLCLHGSAVAWRGRAIAVLGPSGAGKSTLSAALVRRGATLLTDDVIALRPTPQGPAVELGPRGIRLLPDAIEHAGLGDAGLAAVPHNDKLLWDLSGGATDEDGALLLGAVHLLRPAADPGTATRVSALTPQQALRPLVSNWYPPNLMKLMQPADLGRLAELARTLPMNAVDYAHDWGRLEALAALLTP